MGRRKKGRYMNHMHDDYYQGYVPPEDTGEYVYPVTQSGGWNTGDAPKICTACSFTPSTTKQQIFVEYEVWRSLMSICSKVKVEWQALLKGRIEPNGEVMITGYYIPKQEVTGASVKNLDIIDDVFIRDNNIVAGVHSHAAMSCFFSTTDVEHTNMSLIKHNIVVNNKSEYKAQTRIDLPCGMVKFIDADVYTVGSPEATIVGIENIEEKKFGFTQSGWKTDHLPTVDKKEGSIPHAMRWCTVCSYAPEEDGGSCSCVTKNKRIMLPDFTHENYELDYGRTYKLKSHLADKYRKPSYLR